MKRNNLFKAVGIAVLVFVLLSWIVPIVYGIAGIELAGEETVSTQIGFIAIINVILETFSGFGSVVLFILLVGAFYGALKATGAYDKVVDFLAEKVSGKEKCALVTTMIVMAVIASVSGLDLGLLVLFPLLIAFIVKIGYDKMVALSATLGSTIVGMYGATFAGTMYGTNNSLLDLDKFSQMVPKCVLLVLGFAALLFFVIKYCESKKLVFDKESARKALLIEGIVLSVMAFATGSFVVISEVLAGTKLLVTMIVLASVAFVAVCALVFMLSKNIWKTLLVLFSLVFVFSLALTIGFATKSVASVLWIVLASVSLVAVLALIVKLIVDCKNNKASTKKVAAKKVVAVKKAKKVKKTERGALPALIILGMVLLIVFLGTTSWGDIFRSNWFEKAHTSWTGLKIGSFAILEKLFGGLDAFGSWTTIARFQNYSVILILGIIALKIAYKTKWSEVFEGSFEGLKEYLAPALLAVLAYSVFVFAYYNQFFGTVTGNLVKGDFNVVKTGIYAILNSAVYADYYYLSNSLLYNIKSVYTEVPTLSVISVMFTNLYSLVMLVAPTSVLLLVSLSISDVKYNDWFKFIWKLALALFVLSFVVFTVMVMV